MDEIGENKLDAVDVPPKTVAVIDIGTNSVRCVIAESYATGKMEVLEQLTRGVWFGKDTFQRGGLSAQSMRAGIEILNTFQKLFIQYDVKYIRVVATASIREAANADIFIDRIKIATGLDVEIIDPSEEIRYSVSAVHEELGDDFSRVGKNIMIMNVGGGSTLLALLRSGTVINSQSLNLGAIRMREFLASSNDTPQNMAAIYRHNIQEVLNSAESYFPFHLIDCALAMGSEPRFVAKQLGKSAGFGDLQKVNMQQFDHLVDLCLEMETPRLCHEFGINFQTAETTVPALLTYQELLRRTQLSSFHVTSTSMRHGVLRDQIQEIWGIGDSDYQKDVLDAAVSLAEKYHIDTELANQTERLAVRLFEELHLEHGLTPHHRLLLQVAAILQNCGRFVNNRSFHKHSFYLISNSDIFGLSHSDTDITAYVARYSYRNGPKASHLTFMSLPREIRVVICKLAAILRIADALNHGLFPDPERIRCERDGDEFTILLPPDDTFLVKTRSLESQGRMFEDVFGMKVIFRT